MQGLKKTTTMSSATIMAKGNGNYPYSVFALLRYVDVVADIVALIAMQPRLFKRGLFLLIHPLDR